MRQEYDDRKATGQLFVLIGLIIASIVIMAIINMSLIKYFNAYNKTTQNVNEISFEKQTESMQLDQNLTKEREKSKSVLSDRQVYYAGLEDCRITKDTVVYLENLKENYDIYMAYEIYDETNTLIHKTDLIPAGELSKWYPADELSVGTHTVHIKNIPYYEVSEGEYTKLAYQPVNVINITIE